jgi:cobalt transporter subunit CbtB
MAETHSIGTEALPIAQLAVPATLALLLGAFLLLGAGFTTIPAVHNAAHDARHAFAFPCH